MRTLDGVPLVIAAPLDGAWQRAIHAFKYDRRPELAVPLAAPLTAAIAQAGLPIAGLVPVPLHPNRKRTRGFNQAERLARALAPSLHLPVWEGLERVRDTPAQVRLGEHVRRMNLAAAFAWNAAEPPSGRVGLVDDVCTTGSTLLAAAEAVRAAGREVAAFLVLAAPVFPAPGSPPGPLQAGPQALQSFTPGGVTSPATRARRRS